MALFFSTPSPPLFNHFICTSQRHFCNFNSHSAMKKLRLGLKSMYDCYLIPSVKKSIHMDYRFKCEQQKPALGSGVYNEEGNIISFFFFFPFFLFLHLLPITLLLLGLLFISKVLVPKGEMGGAKGRNRDKSVGRRDCCNH